MKRFIDHLKKNWIKYGFETLVVIVGLIVLLSSCFSDPPRRTYYKAQAPETVILVDESYYTIYSPSYQKTFPCEVINDTIFIADRNGWVVTSAWEEISPEAFKESLEAILAKQLTDM